MYRNFEEQAVEYVKQAVQEDNAGNYAKAFPLYKNTLECIRTLLEHEKNPQFKEALTQKFNEYMRRAEEIRAVLDEGSSGPGPAANGDAAVAARPKKKGKDGAGGGEGEDGEQAKPNVKWNDVAGLESAKQPLLAKVINF